MRGLHLSGLLAFLGACWLAAADAPAQQMTIGTPMRTVNEGFHEQIGVNWGLRGRNWSFQFGGANQTAPQFGGFNPNNAATFGFGLMGHGVSGNFNVVASRGSTRSMTGTAPSVTVMNGQQGVISDTSQSPFVISYIPVVGGFPSVGFLNPVVPPPAYMAASQPVPQTIVREYAEALRRAQAERQRAVGENFAGGRAAPPAAADPRPVGDHAPRKPAVDAPGALTPVGGGPTAADAGARRLAVAQASSAGQPAMSVAEARQAHAAQQESDRDEALVWLERARGAEEAGKTKVAAIYYRMAASRATGDLRQQALKRLSALQGTTDGQR